MGYIFLLDNYLILESPIANVFQNELELVWRCILSVNEFSLLIHKQMLPYKNVWTPQSTHECTVDETHGWSNHETGSLITIWGEKSIRQQTIPLPAISIITEGNDLPFPSCNTVKAGILWNSITFYNNCFLCSCNWNYETVIYQVPLMNTV